MNERIREFWYQSVQPYTGDSWSEQTEFMERFAKLIVRECAQVSENDITDGNACCTNTADRIARQIKKHFGVEE